MCETKFNVPYLYLMFHICALLPWQVLVCRNPTVRDEGEAGVHILAVVLPLHTELAGTPPAPVGRGWCNVLYAHNTRPLRLCIFVMDIGFVQSKGGICGENRITGTL